MYGGAHRSYEYMYGGAHRSYEYMYGGAHMHAHTSLGPWVQNDGSPFGSSSCTYDPSWHSMELFVRRYNKQPVAPCAVYAYDSYGYHPYPNLARRAGYHPAAAPQHEPGTAQRGARVMLRVRVGFGFGFGLGLGLE